MPDSTEVVEEYIETSSSKLEHDAGVSFSGGQSHRAARCYIALSERHPERLDVQARFGYLDLLANKPEGAITRLSTVLEHGLRTREILSHLADAYYRADDLRAAVLCYQKARP